MNNPAEAPLVVDGAEYSRSEAESLLRAFLADTERWRQLLRDHEIDHEIDDEKGTPVEHMARRFAFGQSLVQRVARISNTLEHLPEFCGITTAHLTSVIEQTEEAAHGFLGQLQGVDERINGLKSLIRTSDEQSSTYLQNTGDQDGSNMINRLQEFLNGSRGEHKARRRLISGVVHMVNTLNESTEDIQGIAGTTKMLALNARIEATKAGELGNAFAVIANEVRQLAGQSYTASETIRESVMGLSEKMGVIADGQKEMDEREAFLPEISQRLIVLAENYEALATYQKQLLNGADEHGANIEAAILEAIGNIQFQDIVRQQIEIVVNGVEQLAAHCQGILTAADEDAEGGAADAADLIERMRGTYVMARQHQAHALAMGDNEHDEMGETGPAIELF